MDPDENLKQQLRLAREMLAAQDSGSYTAFDDVARLAELVIALDEWLHKGGALPRVWVHTPRNRVTLCGPQCGHSACSQHYIDTGSVECIDRG
jgi:hypothetical protein